ncbi:hypothetical protein QFZ34_001049 [Phyllobacterium ifriqiyense]|uniref:Uncharacterized protein n=1 Tax=Phyllobacterium ifriqiyense TaxID=314238 RepID=A0ABU0S541_9HYPH|nr:hypothetical protein [Phyllobacterium ifriqiyense]MDQ0995872.1 hypothetical protein [Phyllobacterium ifriqiyense]
MITPNVFTELLVVTVGERPFHRFVPVTLLLQAPIFVFHGFFAIPSERVIFLFRGVFD